MNNKNRGLGRLYAPDDRDRRHLLPPRPEAAKITRRMWTAGKGSPLNQGSKPQCVAYAGVHWLTASPVRNKPCDTQELYDECQTVDEWPGEDYDGTSVRAFFKIMKERGLVSEYQWAFDASRAIDHILTVGPLSLGTEWMDGMFEADKSGYIRPTGRSAGGHAYLALGADREKKSPWGAVGAVRILNSWGLSWAQKGRAWLSFEDLNRLILDQGEAGMGVEVRGAVT